MKKTWDEFEKDVYRMIEDIKNFRPEIIVPSMNGALVPAAMISEKINVKDLRPIGIERRGGERTLHYDIHGDVSGKRVLIVEDSMASGNGMIMAKDDFIKRGAIVKTASVYVNNHSKDLSDFYGDVVDPLPNFPWKPNREGDRIVAK